MLNAYTKRNFFLLSLSGDARRIKGACLLYGVYTLRNMLNNGSLCPPEHMVDAILSLSKTTTAHSDIRSAFYYLIDESRPKNKKKCARNFLESR